MSLHGHGTLSSLYKWSDARVTGRSDSNVLLTLTCFQKFFSLVLAYLDSEVSGLLLGAIIAPLKDEWMYWSSILYSWIFVLCHALELS